MKFGMDVIPLGVYPKIVLFNFLQLVMPHGRQINLQGGTDTSTTYIVGLYSDVG
jgi:hypothetical protein